MKIPNIGGLVSIGRAFAAANRPEILFGTSIVSTLGAVVMAARGGYKSGYTVAEEDVKRQVVGQDVLDRKEILKLTWLNYLPAAAGTLGAVGSTTGLHLVHVHEKRQIAAAALMAIEQVKREGEELKNDMLKSAGLATSDDPKEIEKASKKTALARVVGSEGYTDERYLVRDTKTGRDIWSNKRLIEDAVLRLNQRLAVEDTELNQFYKDAGYEHIPDGEEIGWNAGNYVGLEWDETTNDKGFPVRSFLVTPAADASMWEKD